MNDAWVSRTESERKILRDLEVHSKTVRNGRYRKALRRLEAAGLVEVEWDNDAAPHESEIHVVRRPARACRCCGDPCEARHLLHCRACRDAECVPPLGCSKELSDA